MTFSTSGPSVAPRRTGWAWIPLAVLAVTLAACGTNDCGAGANCVVEPDAAASADRAEPDAHGDVSAMDAFDVPAADAFDAPAAIDVAAMDGPPRCTDDSVCVGGLRCDPSSGRCVACVTDVQCGANRVCEANACVDGCRDDAQCGGSTPRCDPAARRCAVEGTCETPRQGLVEARGCARCACDDRQ
jgi:hypothetical protein